MLKEETDVLPLILYIQYCYIDKDQDSKMTMKMKNDTIILIICLKPTSGFAGVMGAAQSQVGALCECKP